MSPLTPAQRATVEEMIAQYDHVIDPSEYQHPDDVALATARRDALAALLAATEPPWIAAKDTTPVLTPKQKRPYASGVQVLIHPPYENGDGYSSAHVVFYGYRYSDRPSFYIYGRLIDVEFWRHLPAPPEKGK